MQGLILVLALAWPRHEHLEKIPPKTVWHNYMGLDGKRLRCTGKPYSDVSFRMWVEGCAEEIFPQELHQ